MSRLYVLVESDKRHPSTCQINENGFITATWGSRETPKVLIQLRINWDNGAEAPTVTLTDRDPAAMYEHFKVI